MLISLFLQLNIVGEKIKSNKILAIDYSILTKSKCLNCFFLTNVSNDVFHQPCIHLVCDLDL